MSAGALRLVGDIGGTNARFAIAQDGGYSDLETYVGDEYPTFEGAVEAYLSKLGEGRRPTEAAFAVAAPVANDQVSFTNHPWSFSRAALKARFDWTRLLVLNDFTANAISIPHLAVADLEQVGGGSRIEKAPVGILGPGTGLGVSGLIFGADGQWEPLQGEGGHATMAPTDERQSQVLAVLRERFGHVSGERVLSGDGLVNLYEALCRIDGAHSAAYKPAQVSDEAIGQTDRLCREAVGMFCSMLGSAAGNLALTLGARGGIYIAGGIVPRLGHRFAESGFRTGFEAKGRFKAYLEAIPTYLITHKYPALVGLSRLP